MTMFGGWRASLRALGAGLSLLAACSDQGSSHGTESESLGTSAQALNVTQTRILGFESVADWSSTAGSLSLSSRHVEGAKSLAAANSGNAVISSVPLSSLGPVADKLTLDLLLPATQPNPNWMGTLQLVIECPSQSLWYEALQQYQLQGKPTDQFLRFEFPLSASTRSKLSTGTYSDLRFRILLNVPQGAGPWLLDRLSVGTSGGGVGGGGGSGGSGGSGGASGTAGTAGIGGAGGSSAGQGASAGTAGTSGASGDPGRDVTFRIVTPKGVTPASVALGATNSLSIGDQTSLLLANGTGHAAASAAGSGGANIGVQTALGDLWSVGGVQLRNYAKVWGNLTTGATTDYQAGASVVGAVTEHATLTPFNVVAWKVAFPQPDSGPVSLEPGITRSVDPGTYAVLAVKTGAHAKLHRGVYRFESGAIEPGGALDIDNSQGPVFLYFRTSLVFSGVTNVQAATDNVLFGVGQMSGQIGSPWKGLLVANGSASFIATTQGHEGSVFADDITLQPQTPFRHHPLSPTLCDPQNPQECGPFCPCGVGGSCDSTVECSSGLSCVAGTCRDCASSRCDGATCDATHACVTGLVCAGGTCHSTCEQAPGTPGCIPASCTNGVKDGNETQVDCGGSCPACGPGTICSADSDCQSGFVCGTNNGGCFNGARGNKVCWPAQCEDGVSADECGQPDSPCGSNCACVVTCAAGDPNCACPAGETRKSGLGALFGVSLGEDVCVDPSCPTNDPLKCGRVNSLCGQQCIGTPDCSHATAADPSDGIGGECPNVCPLGQACCTQDVHCPTGAVCVAQPSGPGICRVHECMYKHLEPPLCGHPGAQCGETCPICTPSCDGRQCGADPICGSSCGTCDAGSSCSASGQCIPSTTDHTPQIPDGNGGTVDLPRLPPGPTAAVGAVAGHFSVSEQGTAHYSVPIDVPPGRAGMEPALSLVYAGPRFEGNVGSGWKLDGLSQITRCQRIYAIDGYAAPIKNDTTDLFCIDGKRLETIVGSAAYGTEGAEYRTLVDTFTKVVSHIDSGPRIRGEPWPNVPPAADGNLGPDWFQVWTKDGRILTYGKAREALILARNGVRASWLLERVEDRSGNSMVVHYTNQRIEMPGALSALPASVVTPDSISYTGHGSTDGDRHLRFEYESRVDSVTRFAQAGAPIVANVRLKRIKTFIGTSPVKNYRIEYTSAAQSQIERIFECAGEGDTTCKPPTVFEYDASVGFEAPMNGSPGASAAQLDINGDGLPDYLTTTTQVDGVPANPTATAAFVTADIMISVGSMAMTPLAGAAVNLAWALTQAFLFDALSKPPKVTYSTAIDVGQGNRTDPFHHVVSNGRPCVARPSFFMDFDQDGKDDSAAFCTSSLLKFARSTGQGNFEVIAGSDVELPSTPHAGFTNTPGASAQPILYDVNGDSLQDLVSCSNDSTLQVRFRRDPLTAFTKDPDLFYGGRSVEVHQQPLLYPPADGVYHERIPFCGDGVPTHFLNDIDGDGTPELVAFYSPSADDRTVFPPAGSLGPFRPPGFYALRVVHDPITLASKLDWQAVNMPRSGSDQWGSGAVAGDYNGDGLVDIFTGFGSTSNFWLNTGDGFELQTMPHPRPVLSGTPNALLRRAGTLDFDGDGKLDLLESWSPPSDFGPQNVLLQPLVSPFPNARLLSDTLLLPAPNGVLHPVQVDGLRDVDGDGNLDLLGEGRVFFGKSLRHGLLSSVKDGLGNTIHVSYDNAYEANETTCRNARQWPEQCLKRMQGLVSSYTTGFDFDFGDGSGSTIEEQTYRYHYENARLSMTGHGWLGFDKVTVTHQSGGVVTTTTTEFEPPTRYDLAGIAKTPSDTLPPYLYPLAGQPRVVTVDQASVGGVTPPPTLEDGEHGRRTVRSNTWTVKLSADHRPYPLLSSSTTETFSRSPSLPFSEDGTLRTECDESNGRVDGYGNARDNTKRCIAIALQTNGIPVQPDGVPVVAAAPHFLEVVSTTTDTFTLDSANWLIEHPHNIKVTASRYPSFVAQTQEYNHDYESNGLLASVTRDPSGANEQTVYHHDEFGNVDSVTRRAGGLADRVTTVTYDDANLFPILVQNAVGHQTQIHVDPRFGSTDEVVDPNGVSLQHSLDGFGRRTLTVGPSGSTVYAYAALPFTRVRTTAGADNGLGEHPYIYPRLQITSEQTGTAGSFGGHSERLLDSHGRVVRSTTVGFAGAEITADQTFDARGRVAAASVPHTEGTTPVPFSSYEYDYLDRLAVATLPDGSTTEHQYGSGVHLAAGFQKWLDNLECPVNAPATCGIDVELSTQPHKPGEPLQQRVAIHGFDGQIVRTIDGENLSLASPDTSDFEYVVFGGLSHLTDNRGSPTDIQHDPYGRVTQRTDADSGTTKYTYTPFSEVATSLDAKAQRRTFSYDHLGRLTNIDDDAGSTSWFYDDGVGAIGQLTDTFSPASAQAPDGQIVHYDYEPPTATSRRALLKSLTYVLDTAPYELDFTYDDLARPKQIDYPSLGTGAPIKARYDYDPLSGALQALTEVGDNATRPIWAVTDAFQGQLPSTIQFGNGATSTLTYDPQNYFLDSIQTKLDGQTIQNLGYSRFANGQVKELQSTHASQSDHFAYEYDPLGRLHQLTKTLAGEPESVAQYLYDPHGNLTQNADRLNTYRPESPHFPDQVGSNLYFPDANGNLDRREGPDVPGNVQNFKYTPFDLPSAIATGKSGVSVTQFEYTADQQRVVRRDPDLTHYYASDLYERTASPSGITTEEHFRLTAGGAVVAEIIRTPAAQQTLFFHPDQLGTPETYTDDTGATFHQTFSPFGARPNDATTPLTRIGFTGQHQDDDLALIDMAGRVYDPLAGRFTTADPILQAPYSSQGQNRFAYVFNDPINMTDPSGFDGIAAEGGFTGAFLIGGTVNGALQGAAAPGVGAAGIGASLGMTLGFSPFGGSPAGSYNIAAPSSAPSSNPVRPGGMDATAAGAGTTPLKWPRAGRPSNWGRYLAQETEDPEAPVTPGSTQYVETAEGDVVEEAVYGAEHVPIMRPFVQPEEALAWGARLEPFEQDVELERPDCPCHEPDLLRRNGIGLLRGQPAAPDMHAHHGLPNQFAPVWRQLGLEKEDFRMQMDPDWHEQIHRRGVVPGLGPGGLWNEGWRQFFMDELSAGRPLSPFSVMNNFATMTTGNGIQYFTPLVVPF